jgi:hypothetical protein
MCLQLEASAYIIAVGGHVPAKFRLVGSSTLIFTTAVAFFLPYNSKTIIEVGGVYLGRIQF